MTHGLDLYDPCLMPILQGALSVNSSQFWVSIDIVGSRNGIKGLTKLKL